VKDLFDLLQGAFIKTALSSHIYKYLFILLISVLIITAEKYMI